MPLNFSWTLASSSLAAAFSTVSALSFCCLTVFQPPQLTTATVWIEACLLWYSLYLFSGFVFCVVDVISLFQHQTHFPPLSPQHMPVVAVGVICAISRLCSEKCHSMCERPSSLQFLTEGWPERCWHQHKGTHSEWRLYLPYSNKAKSLQLTHSDRLQKIWKWNNLFFPFLELSVFGLSIAITFWQIMIEEMEVGCFFLCGCYFALNSAIPLLFSLQVQL